MKKNPLAVLLAISGSLFVLFLVFIFFAFGFIFDDGDDFIAIGSGGGNVAVLPIEGVILTSKKVLEDLKKFEEDDNIKAVIVRVESPGGAVAPSQEIYHALMRLRDTKPVVASFGSIAASGGYYIGAAANKIVANAGTITGSIGVIMQFINLSGVYEWAKVSRIHITSGKFKDTGTDIRSMTAEEKQLLQGMVDNVHSQFVQAIVDGRNMRNQKVSELADGRIYSGEQAFKAGLVDNLGGLKEAVDLAKELADIEGEPKLVYPQKKRQRFFVELFSTRWLNWLPAGLQEVMAAVFANTGSARVASSVKPGIYYIAPAFL